MHKGLLLVLQADADTDGALLCAVLNRPTSASVSFNLPGRPSRRLPICGSLPLPRSLAKDGQGQLWLHHRAELGGSALGRSGLGLGLGLGLGSGSGSGSGSGLGFERQ